MDADRFDALIRSISAAGSRRTLARSAAGVVAVFAGASAAEAGTCGPCERTTKRGCRPLKDNTICRTNGCCRDGRCHAQPTCLGAGEDCSGRQNGCCGGRDACVGNLCLRGKRNRPCHGDQDCRNGGICVGYVCR